VRILVTGAGGQLGTAIIDSFSSKAEVVPLDRAALELTDANAVAAAVAHRHPDVIINCAAYNDVDGAEDNVSTAFANNAFAVLSLAQAAAARATLFIHYGTDFVFDGHATTPYTEEDQTSPQSAYGASKLVGEWFAADARAYYVLRVESLFGGRQRRSSIDKIAEALTAGKPARVFEDRTVTPSFVNDVADATWALIERRAPYGVYHCVNTGVTTWLGIGTRLKELLSASGELVPVRTADVTLKARRPQYCALSNAKLASVGIQMPAWDDAVERYLRSLRLIGAG
jgi:dTDP-4-dehydrorhamnose reductase